MSRPGEIDWNGARQRLERARLALESEARPAEQLEALYRERARMLAQPLALRTEIEGEAIVVFRLGQEHFGIPLTRVLEGVSRPRVTPAPGVPPAITGLMQLRGEIRVVWDLRRLLQLPPAASRDGMMALLLRTGAVEACLLVDELEDIRAVTAGDRRPAMERIPHAAWMTSDLVVVLDIESLFSTATEESPRS